MITYTDLQVGEIMKLLKELGLDINTIIMFLSDNRATFDTGGADTNFFNSTAGLRGRKQDLYEGESTNQLLLVGHEKSRRENDPSYFNLI